MKRKVFIVILFTIGFTLPTTSTNAIINQSACESAQGIYCSYVTWHWCGVAGCDYGSPSGRLWCNGTGHGSCNSSQNIWDRNCWSHYCAGFNCAVDITLPCLCQTDFCNC